MLEMPTQRLLRFKLAACSFRIKAVPVLTDCYTFSQLKSESVGEQIALFIINQSLETPLITKL